MKTKTTSIGLLLATLFAINPVFSQNKYDKSQTVEQTKPYGTDTVSSMKSLSENLTPIGRFAHFLKALNAAGLTDEVQGEGLYTVFVIPDSHFETRLPEEKERNAFLDKVNQRKLSTMLRPHIIPGSVDRHSLERELERRGGTVSYRTLSDNNITFGKDNSGIYIEGANGKVYIRDFDLFYNNGTFHAVEGFVAFPERK